MGKFNHQQFKTTCIYVTHDQTEAMTMASRVLILNQGMIEQLGTPQLVYQQPASVFVAGFTGHYPMNFIKGTFDKKTDTVHTDLGVSYPAPTWTASIDDDASLILAIRPEHVTPCAIGDPGAILLTVEWIDDMGADKVVHTQSIHSGVKLTVRLPSDFSCSDQQIAVVIPEQKLHVFDEKTGRRAGEWRG